MTTVPASAPAVPAETASGSTEPLRLVPARAPAEPVLQALPGGRLKARVEQAFLLLFVVVPFAAVVAAVPLLWGRYVAWYDVAIAIAMYAVTGHGVTVGFHRGFTHRAFRPNRFTKVALAVAGTMAIEGPVIRWVADHRRHHAFSDRAGDPHSPHRYGAGLWPMIKGFCHAHVGWLFDAEQTNQRRFAPDLLADKDLRAVNRLFAPLAIVSLGLPALLGFLLSGLTWHGTVSAFFWAGLVRIFVLHHVTWSINSVCHTVGSRPFATRDRSRNVWPLALISMGESWHNLHHADPTAARHGVGRLQIDTSAMLIRGMEALRMVREVRWPTPERLAQLAARRPAPVPG